jgi:hypothetical protein
MARRAPRLKERNVSEAAKVKLLLVNEAYRSGGVFPDVIR